MKKYKDSEAFKIGDVVGLKSGGPDMTVNENCENSGMVACVWFAGKKLEDDVFHPDVLKKLDN